MVLYYDDFLTFAEEKQTAKKNIDARKKRCGWHNCSSSAARCISLVANFFYAVRSAKCKIIVTETKVHEKTIKGKLKIRRLSIITF